MSLIAGRILSLLPAILFLNMAYGWITNPSEAAKGLGMPLLDDIGRSTQIGDFSAFFIGVGLFSLLGALTNKVTYIYCAIIILLSAAIMRIVSWQIHEAEFASFFIGVEIASVVILFISTLLIRSGISEKNEISVDQE
jgi:hypothetical protein